jgi:hypothetical protein
MVDDATSRSAGRFSAEETIWAAAAVLRGWIEAHGVPLALYTDWKNVYVRTATDAERAAGTAPLTQFGRMCAALQIQIIAASSPQAKGRVERNHGTHQDRLVKKLRRRGIADDAAANQFLEADYWAAHNARFAQLPADATDFHRRRPSTAALDRIFRIETTRTLSLDWVVRYDARSFQLRRQSHYVPARSTVIVCEWPDGRIAIEYRGRVQAWTEITGVPKPTPAARPAPPPSAPSRPPSGDHPWRKSYKSVLVSERAPLESLASLKGTFLSS